MNKGCLIFICWYTIVIVEYGDNGIVVSVHWLVCGVLLYLILTWCYLWVVIVTVDDLAIVF